VPKWLWALLVASLSANLLVAGAWLGAGWRMHRGWERHGGPDALRNMPEERRQKLRSVLGERHREIAPRLKALREQRREAARLLEAEPFDKKAFVDAMTRYIDAEAKVRAEMQPIIAEAAGQMTAEERRAFLRQRRHWRQLIELTDGERGPRRP
jgi:uncharacterized membrane protein